MDKQKRNVVVGFLGLEHMRDKRTADPLQWRPSISLFEHEDFPVHAFHVLHPPSSPVTNVQALIAEVFVDITWISPETVLKSHVIGHDSPWRFEDVYRELYAFCEKFPFDTENENYFFHITIGTHVQQICAYLLTESHRFPGKLLQTFGQSPYRKNERPGYTIVDPHQLPISIRDITRRSRIDNLTVLKSGFPSVNRDYNDLIADLQLAAVNSAEPILILGETGTGKSVEARKIYEVKKSTFHLAGKFIEVNCAAISKELAVATLFGYRKGDYSGATHDQAGLLAQADKGILFLDEIGELSLEVQAMLLQAIETKRFKVFGIHEESSADFQLVCGTNRDLEAECEAFRFREDLLARINFWTFTLPPLRERKDDISGLVDYYIDEWSAANYNVVVTFEAQARKDWLDFSAGEQARWPKNLRELNHSIKRMCYFSRTNNDCITGDTVFKEINRLRASWMPGESKNGGAETSTAPVELRPFLSQSELKTLEEIIRICSNRGTLRDAGETLFASESDHGNKNYSDLARKFLDRCCAHIPGSRFTLDRRKGLLFVAG